MRISRTFLASALLAGVLPNIVPGAAVAESPAPASRIIVSSTLNHTLMIIDAETLEMTQPLLPSRGTSPVRLVVQDFEGKRYLFSANHGINASLGIFDLDLPIVVESPVSPLPTGGAGGVGIDAGYLHGVPAIAMTNTVFALGGCSMPKGSLSLFNASGIGTGLPPRLAPVRQMDGAIPYAVAIDELNDRLYASSNCGNNIEISDVSLAAEPVGAYGFEIGATTKTPLAAGPDATMFDAERDRSYTVNIGGNSLSVIDGTTRTVVTTVPMPGTGPIDATLVTSKGGADWIVTSNGKNDTFGIIDRSIIEACITAEVTSCPSAYVAQISAGVAGGAPEGINYDARSGRMFVVNKTLGAPKLSVIQITEGTQITGTLVGIVPIGAIDPSVPVPAIIAFDVAVDDRGL